MSAENDVTTPAVSLTSVSHSIL